MAIIIYADERDCPPGIVWSVSTMLCQIFFRTHVYHSAYHTSLYVLSRHNLSSCENIHVPKHICEKLSLWSVFKAIKFNSLYTRDA